jgi:hypothetical protein
VANEFQLGHATRRGKTSSEQLGKPQFIWKIHRLTSSHGTAQPVSCRPEAQLGHPQPRTWPPVYKQNSICQPALRTQFTRRAVQLQRDSNVSGMRAWWRIDRIRHLPPFLRPTQRAVFRGVPGHWLLRLRSSVVLLLSSKQMLDITINSATTATFHIIFEPLSDSIQSLGIAQDESESLQEWLDEQKANKDFCHPSLSLTSCYSLLHSFSACFSYFKKKEAYDINLLSVCLCILPTFSFFMQPVSYRRKVGD